MVICSVPGINETLNDGLPPGLQLITNFITQEEELLLLNSIDWNDEDGKYIFTVCMNHFHEINTLKKKKIIYRKHRI